MAPHSITLAWKIPWMEEPGGLQSTGSLRVGTFFLAVMAYHSRLMFVNLSCYKSVTPV